MPHLISSLIRAGKAANCLASVLSTLEAKRRIRLDRVDQIPFTKVVSAYFDCRKDHIQLFSIISMAMNQQRKMLEGLL